MGPPMTYMDGGKQYVALAGGQGAGGRGGAQVAPKLLVFTLDGKASLPVIVTQ
jgi:hypothetical protein